MTVQTKHFYAFGPFRFDSEKRVLVREGAPVPLAPKATEILLALVEQAGHLVDKDALINRVWPDAFVEEGNLNKNIFFLRKALGTWESGQEYIETVPKRGYRFVAPVSEVTHAEGRPQPSPVGTLIGKKVSHYRVLEILGGGGMGVVYKAEDLKLGRRVALKFLPEELGKDPKAVERFEREARATSSLDHPNICAIHEFGEHDGQPFLVMQLLEGKTLRDRISEEAPFPIVNLLDTAIQIVEGLGAAHQKGIIHRDIKPANIFITERGVAKILDFGMVKLASDRTEAEASPVQDESKGSGSLSERKTIAGSDPSLTLTGVVMGTAGYMSPEQVRGERQDARTDLFSFGLILYEMATSHRAFNGDTVSLLHDAILNRAPTPARRLNPGVPPGLENIITKCLEKDRERRYQTAAELCSDLSAIGSDTKSDPLPWNSADTDRSSEALPPRVNPLIASVSVGNGTRARLRQMSWHWILSSVAVLALLALVVVIVVHAHRPPRLNEADLILVSDLVNTTGEAVFDGSLKQALTVKLAESPYFNVVPDSTTRQTLSLMGRSADQRVVPPIARDVCQREGAKAVVGGSILSAGVKYVLELDAVNCLTGANLAHLEIEALNRDEILHKLGGIVPALRRKLGESMSSIEKFDTPIEQATTKSLGALKAYTSGDQKRSQGKEAESIPFYKMAIELDPDFAIAYARLGTVYGNLNEPDLSDENLLKAFERREHVSEREKFYIQAHYYEDTTRETDKANETYKLWTEVYPHDFLPFNGLSSGYITVGQFDKAIEASQQALRVNPSHALAYANLSRAFERATRFPEAKAICERAVTERIDSSWTHQVLYRIAFVEGDESTMQRELDWFKGKPQESVARYLQAKVALSQGELRRSREIFESALSLARQRGLEEVGVAVLNGQAQFDADVGDARDVPALADEVLRSTPNSVRHKAFATLALARAGDARRAQTLVTELSKQSSLGTALSDVVLPSIRAAIDLDRSNPAAAIEELQAAGPYDLGGDSGGVTVYYRGLAYLGLKSGKEAAAQFQRILDNRGVVTIDIYWPLAHLGLARAYVLEGDTAKARTAYQDFLRLWKDADPDLPTLRLAKSEYETLQ